MVQLFSNRLKIAAFYLNNTYCIAKYSFIVLKSVDYLDLSLCELSSLRGKRGKKIHANNILSLKTMVTTNFVCTEEGCKKTLAINRKILYRFHLDVSSGLELRFENTIPNKDLRYHSDNVLLNKLAIEKTFFAWRLEPMAEIGLRRSKKRVKYFHQISKLAQCINFISPYGHIRRNGADFLYSDCWDANIVKDFLIAMNFEDGYLLHLRPEVVGYLLYHASCVGYRLKDILPPREDWINFAIFEKKFQHVTPLFQYLDKPKFCEYVYNIMLWRCENESSVPIDVLDAPVENGLQSKERNFLMVQIFYLFCKERERGLTALQLVWRSVPQAYISLDELIAAYPILYGSRFLEEIHGYISDITGEENFHPEPRKLKHFCRVAIRKALSRNVKLFSGIDEISVPPALLSFLKLEM